MAHGKIEYWKLPSYSPATPAIVCHEGAQEDEVLRAALARMFNPIIQGWINYYSRYYKSALYPILKCLERRLAIWATRKYKRLRHHKRRAAQWLNRIARKQPNLFAHWKMLYATAGR